MTILLLEAYGSDFTLTEAPRPAPKAGEVLVQVKASGVNPLDLKIKAGKAAHAQVQLPAILGIDMAGVVVATGAEAYAAVGNRREKGKVVITIP